MNNFIAVIPAKSRSTRVPGKNMLDICGKPLLWYTINVAIKSNCFDKIIVSSDSDEIIKYAEKMGLKVPFKRPNKLSMDTTSTFDVVSHAINFLKGSNNYRSTNVAILEPTSPLRKVEDILEGVSLQNTGEFDGVVSVVKSGNNHPIKAKINEGNLLKSHTKSEGKVLRSQELPNIYFRNGAFYSFNVDYLKDNHKPYEGRIGFFVMPEDRSIDINNNLDLKVCRMLISENDV